MTRILALLLVLSAGCIPRVPQQKAASPTPIAIGWGLDGERNGTALEIPEKLRERITGELADRNLQVKDQGAIGPSHLTAIRLEALRKAQPTGFLLLVEARPAFFSQHDGRYRWSVAVKLTASIRPGVNAEDTFTLPALLQFEHQREPEALNAVVDDIAKRVGTLVDGMLIEAPVARVPPNGLVYFVMVDRFANGDRLNDSKIDLDDPSAFHGGDLQGVIDRLDWLQSLGVRTVWLSPVFAMRQEKIGAWGAFHGYWTWDLNKIEPRFGDEALLAKLSDSLHARGMRLVLDLVLNHVGPGAPLLTQHPDWFHHQGDIKDWNDPVQLVSGDVHGLPDLATEQEAVYQYLLAASLKWVRVARVDGFRLDAVKHLPLGFWSRFNADVHQAAGADFELLGEMLDGDPQVVAQVQREGGFSSMFDFPLHFALIDVFCRQQSAAHLGAVLTSDRLYPAPQALTTLADNHDLPRLMSACQLDLARSSQALTFLLTARGSPSIIWGTEVGQVGDKDPANRPSMVFADAPLHKQIAQWTALRAVNPAIDHGAPLVLEASHDVFACLRLLDDQAALFVFNRTGAPWKAPAVEQAVWRDALTGVELAEAITAPRSVRVFVTPRASRSFSDLAAVARALSEGKAETRPITFVARGAPLGKDDEVRVVGSGPELGAWRPEAGLKLTGSTGTAVLPMYGVFEFKLAVKSGAGPWRWQSGENQVLQVKGPVEIELAWREG